MWSLLKGFVEKKAGWDVDSGRVMFLLFDLLYLSLVSGLIWTVIVTLSLSTTVKRFYKQSITRYWEKEH